MGEDDSVGQFVQQLQDELGRVSAENINLKSTMSMGQMAESKDRNLVEVQIETRQLLDDLERFYRGQIEQIEIDNGDGTRSIQWKKPENTELVTFNEFGVSSLMEILHRYIDKNTSLSWYTEERIYEILGDIGDEMILFIECNYEKMGMDTYFKKTKFRLIIATTLHTIESTYRRALRGNTFTELNRSTLVTQNDHLSNFQQGSKRQGFLQRIFNPGRYVR